MTWDTYKKNTAYNIFCTTTHCIGTVIPSICDCSACQGKVRFSSTHTEGMWGSRGIAPSFLNLHNLVALLPQFPANRRLGRSQSKFEYFKDKSLLLLPAIE